MFRLILSNVRYNRARYLATLVAIVIGVAFYAAAGFVADDVVASLEGNVDDQYGAVTVAVVVDDSSDAGATEAAISKETADELAALPGVEGSAATLTAPVGFLNAAGKPVATDATGRLWIEDEKLNPLHLESGAAPASSGEIAVDQGLAKAQDLAVGDDATLLTLGGPQQVRVVGVTSFGNTDAIDQGGTVSVAPQDAFAWLSNGREQYQAVFLRGQDASALLAEAKEVTPPGFRAVDGSTFLVEQRNSSGGIGRTLKTALQAFAILALLVGGFVIYNTFTVIVAQRLRELAVLSAIGATGRQLKRSLRWEGIVIGLIGSIIGVLVGLVLSLGLVGLASVFGSGLAGGVVIHASPFVGGIVLGTLITAVSVLLPARRAARTEPIEAMRDAAVETGVLSRRRGVVAAVLVVLGLLAMLAAPAAWLVGAGVVLFVASLLVGAPFIAVAGSALLRPLLSARGLEGRLAVDNARRNPKRTATTANALVIGVFLVTLVAVVGTTLKEFALGQVNAVQSADFVVTSTGGTIDDAFMTQLQGVPKVDTLVAVQRSTAAVGDQQQQVSAADVDALEKAADLGTDSGSLADLADGTIAVPAGSGDPGVAVGSTVVVTPPQGDPVSLEVVAVVTSSIDSAQVGNLVSPGTFDELFGEAGPTVAFVDVATGAESDTQTAIQDLADQRPDITVTEGNAIGKLIAQVFDFVIKAVTGLLLMSVLVALVGIVNTLSLSILERRRELGLLRIVGMTDDRVRRMVRLESLVIAVLGTVTGVVAGVVVSLCLTLSVNRLSSAHISAHAPWIELAVILVLGVVLGLVAALVPAQRSTRMSALDAVQAT